MITMDGTPQIRTRANTVAGTPLSSVSANRSSTNGGNVYKMADFHQKTALSYYRKCTIFEEIVFHELQIANFVGICGYKTNYTNRGPGKQCVKVFRLLFGIKRSDHETQMFCSAKCSARKGINAMLLQAFLAFRFTILVGNNFFCGNTRQPGNCLFTTFPAKAQNGSILK